MIDRLLPDAVVVVETREDLMNTELFPAEAQSLGRAVEKRRREFMTGRACARLALERLGVTPVAIASGERGEPLWPAGVVGSITHCATYRACAIARARQLATIGIDAEPDAALPDGVLAQIAGPEERGCLAELRRTAPVMHWDRLLFSAKESAYKASFPISKRRLGFEDAVVEVDPVAGTFSARLPVWGPTLADGQPGRLSGRWLAQDGLLLTAVALAAPEATAPRG
jgi:4'-phosphopantetheinyl transferase EntD